MHASEAYQARTSAQLMHRADACRKKHCSANYVQKQWFTKAHLCRFTLWQDLHPYHPDSSTSYFCFSVCTPCAACPLPQSPNPPHGSGTSILFAESHLSGHVEDCLSGCPGSRALQLSIERTLSLTFAQGH